MDKIQLVFLGIFAVAGGYMCDQFFALSFPFFTVCFLLVTGILFFASQTKTTDEEE